MSRNATGVLCAVFLLALIPTAASAQLLSQSRLTAADADPNFRLTVDHLAEDARWLGLAPRQLRWSPDGATVYFRWREDPNPDQNAATDPWYAVDRAGRSARKVEDTEAMLIPAQNVDWSAGRRLAAWGNNGALYVWTPERGTVALFTAGGEVNVARVSADGAAVYFHSGEDDELWALDTRTSQVRRVARVTEKKEDTTGKNKAADWLKTQQEELLETIRKRKQDQALEDSLRLFHAGLGPQPPQAIPLEKGAEARNIQLSPDGRYVTFQWSKEPATPPRTLYMDYVTETGYAEERRSRAKVGEGIGTYKMGIVRVDPTVPEDSVDIVWVDDGVEKETIIHGPFWSPRGDAAVVQILSMDHKDRWIAKLDVATGKTTVIDHQNEEAWIGGPLVEGRWSGGFLEWLPDGSGFGFGSTATGWAMLYLGTPDGKVTQLTNGEWEVREAELSADGRFWYLTTSRDHPGEEQLYRLPAHGGDLERITTGEGWHQASVSPDGQRVATVYETSERLGDLYLLDAAPGAEMLQITRSGTDAFYRIPWQRSSIVKYADGQGEDTWAEIWPRPANANTAAVVYVHGCGECAQAVNKRFGGRHRLFANWLYQNGYVAASLDYRGSSGYGHANRTYAYRKMGITDVDSGLGLLDILATQYGADRGRIGMYGCSYGGFFTLMSLFRHPGKYAAGVAQCSVTDWAHYNHGYTSRILNGAPYEDPEAYRVSSPIYYADGLQDALQIQHGVIDGNVQLQDIFRLQQVLIEKKKDFELALYPVEAHGFAQEPSRHDLYRRMIRFFEENLLGEKRMQAKAQAKAKENSIGTPGEN